MKDLRKRLANFLVNCGVWLNAPRFTALLLWKSCRFLGGPEAKHHVLCIRRNIFVDDLQALSQADEKGEFQFAILPKSKLSVIMHAFMRRDPDDEALTEFNYHKGNHAKAMAGYHSFLDAVLQEFQRRWKIDAMLMANFGYMEQQELAKLAGKHSIPYIVLFKEGLLVPDHLDRLAPEYINGKRFLGDKILFYSEQIRQAVLKSDAFEGAELESGVTGIPRMDPLVRMPPGKEKHMVFYSFYPPDKFRSFGCSQDLYDQSVSAGDEFHRQVLEFAAQNPDWKVVIKSKVNERYYRYVLDIKSELGRELPNVEITNTTSAATLLADSSVVLAFNSTTLLEAMLAGRTIITPDFRNIFPEGGWDYFGKCPELVCYASTAQDIRSIVGGEFEPVADYEKRRDSFLHEMVNNADGQASLRVLEQLRQSIERKGKEALDSSGGESEG